MSVFDEILTSITEEADSYEEKARLAEYLIQAVRQGRAKFESADRDTLATFAMSELEGLLPLVEETESYREKDEIFNYAQPLLGLVVLCYGSPGDVPEAHMETLRTLGELTERERFVENAVDEVFEDRRPTAADIDRLLCVVSPLKDEYRKGKLFLGLIHFQREVGRLPADAKDILARYTESELRRYLDMPSFDKDVLINLELMADVCSLYMTDAIEALLPGLLERGNSIIQFCTLSTLLNIGRPVPDEVIDALAHDLEYADMTYRTLKEHGMTARFPAELANDEYLARSNMIRWLVYPTELGQMPDEIEYLGCVKKGVFGGEKYHVFRFKSESRNLGEEQKGRWLIGWAGEEDGTFSNFDLYDDFDGGSPDKTLKNIKRKLL